MVSFYYYSPTIISTFYTLHNFSTVLCFLLQLIVSLSLSSSSRSTLFSYSLLSVNSLIFFILNVYLICVQFLFKWWENRGKGEQSKFYFWVFCVFLSYIWIFPLAVAMRLSKKKKSFTKKNSVCVSIASFLISVH